MLPTAGNTPHDVLSVLRAHAARAAGEDQFLAIGPSHSQGAGTTPCTSGNHPTAPCASRSTGSTTGAGPSGNGCPSPSCPGIRSAAPRPPCGPARTQQPAIGMTLLPGRPFPRLATTGNRCGHWPPPNGNTRAPAAPRTGHPGTHRLRIPLHPAHHRHLGAGHQEPPPRPADPGPPADPRPVGRRRRRRGPCRACPQDFQPGRFQCPELAVGPDEHPGRGLRVRRVQRPRVRLCGLDRAHQQPPGRDDDRAWAEITCLAGLGGGTSAGSTPPSGPAPCAGSPCCGNSETPGPASSPASSTASAASRALPEPSEPRCELSVTMSTQPGLEAFAAQAAGPVVTVADRSWPRDGSRVWELASTSGERFYLKQHQSQRFHDREVTAYRLWAPALGTGRAPRLLAADPGLRAS